MLLNYILYFLLNISFIKTSVDLMCIIAVSRYPVSGRISASGSARKRSANPFYTENKRTFAQIAELKTGDVFVSRFYQKYLGVPTLGVHTKTRRRKVIEKQ